MGISLHDLFTNVPPETRELVERAKSEYMKRVQDCLRNRTGLSRRARVDGTGEVAADRDQLAVPVNVEDGISITLENAVLRDLDPISVAISSHRIDLERTLKGLSRLNPLLQRLSKTVEGQGLLNDRLEDVTETTGLLNDLLHRIQDFDLGRIILSLKDDALGAYIVGSSDTSLLASSKPRYRIELYWMVIGWFAQRLEVHVEDLTVVILAHEQSHAYTHLGMDEDGCSWSDLGFARSDNFTKEGLAQYYTSAVVEVLSKKNSGIKDAYERLLALQDCEYHAHIRWLEDYTPECVKFAMLQIRRHSAGKIDRFEEALVEAKKSLQKR